MTLLLALVAVLAPAPAAASVVSDFEGAVHRLTNATRVDHDLVTLRKKGCVDRFANRQAKRMAAKEKMFHQDLAPILQKCGLSLVGENVAYGYSRAGAVMKAWMGSSAHAANILDPRYRLLGVGARKSDDGVWYLAQVFGRK